MMKHCGDGLGGGGVTQERTIYIFPQPPGLLVKTLFTLFTFFKVACRVNGFVLLHNCFSPLTLAETRLRRSSTAGLVRAAGAAATSTRPSTHRATTTAHPRTTDTTTMTLATLTTTGSRGKVRVLLLHTLPLRKFLGKSFRCLHKSI